MKKARTPKQSEALALLNAKILAFKANPAGYRWNELLVTMRIYQEASQNAEGQLLTVAQAVKDLKESGNL